MGFKQASENTFFHEIADAHNKVTIAFSRFSVFDLRKYLHNTILFQISSEIA